MNANPNRKSHRDEYNRSKRARRHQEDALDDAVGESGKTARSKIGRYASGNAWLVGGFSVYLHIIKENFN